MTTTFLKRYLKASADAYVNLTAEEVANNQASAYEQLTEYHSQMVKLTDKINNVTNNSSCKVLTECNSQLVELSGKIIKESETLINPVTKISLRERCKTATKFSQVEQCSNNLDGLTLIEAVCGMCIEPCNCDLLDSALNTALKCNKTKYLWSSLHVAVMKQNVCMTNYILKKLRANKPAPCDIVTHLEQVFQIHNDYSSKNSLNLNTGVWFYSSMLQGFHNSKSRVVIYKNMVTNCDFDKLNGAEAARYRPEQLYKISEEAGKQKNSKALCWVVQQLNIRCNDE